MQMRRTFLFIVISLVLVYVTLQASYQPTTDNPNEFTTACTNLGASTLISQMLQTKTVLANSLILLQQTKSFNHWVEEPGRVSSINIFDIQVRTQSSERIITKTLIISNISHIDGTKYSQTSVLSDDYQFVDADGPFCLIKQTLANIPSYSLYYMDTSSSDGAALLIKSVAFSSLNPDVKFTKIFNYYDLADSSKDKVWFLSQNYQSNVLKYYYIGGDLYSASTLNLVDQTTGPAITLSSGFQHFITDYMYMKISDSNSNDLTWQIIPHNPAHSYSSVDTMLNSLKTYGSINSIEGFSTSQFVFLLLSNKDTQSAMTSGMIYNLAGSYNFYQFTLYNNPTPVSRGKFTDKSSYFGIYELSQSSCKFEVLWIDTILTQNYRYTGSFNSPPAMQFGLDVANALNINGIVYTNTSGVTGAYLSLYMYSGTKIIKYNFWYIGMSDAGGDEYHSNKEFQSSLTVGFQNILSNPHLENFKISSKLDCMCIKSEITNFICFYGTDQCTFTVQNVQYICDPLQ